MTKTAKLYGSALYDVALEDSAAPSVLEEMQAVQTAFAQHPDFLYLLDTPSLPKAERCGILQETFDGQVHPYLLNFLKILCENGTLRQFGGCLRAYKNRYNEDHHIMEVTAITAIPMKEAQIAALHSKLESQTGKTVALTCRVDPDCLGGVRLEMEGQQWDDTVRCRLDTISRQLAGLTL